MKINKILILIGLLSTTYANVTSKDVGKIDPARAIISPNNVNISLPKHSLSNYTPIKKIGDTIFIKKIVVKNQKNELRQEVESLLTEYVKKETSTIELSTLLQKITVIYRNAGYIFSRAIIPKQNIQYGIIIIKITHAKITEYELVADVSDINREILQIIGSKITKLDDNNFTLMQRYAKIANDIHGIDTKFVLSPLLQGKNNQLSIQAKRQRVNYDLHIDNKANKSLGLYRINNTLRINDILFGGSIQGSYITSVDFKKLHYFSGEYHKLLTSEGLAMKILVSRTHTRPELSEQVFQGESGKYNVTFLYPFIYSHKHKLSVSFGGQGAYTTIKVKSAMLYEDVVRTLEASCNYELADDKGIWIFDNEISQGLDIFNAKNINSTRAASKLIFTKFDFNIARIQYLSNKLIAIVNTRLQTATTPVSSLYEFGAGGSEYGQAFHSSEITGQNGFGWKIDCKYLIGSLFDDIVDMTSLNVMYDGGTVWGKYTNNNYLHSLGAGVDFRLYQVCTCNLTIAYPIAKSSAVSDDGLKFNFSIKFSV